MKLWHCQDARSLRALWALEEMGLPYELEVMPFPPRFLHAGYLEVNPLGTVPYFVDGDHALTESSGICHYLVERYQQYDFGVRPEAARVRRLPQLAVSQRCNPYISANALPEIHPARAR